MPPPTPDDDPALPPPNRAPRPLTGRQAEAYHRMADAMRRLEWDIANRLWQGEGLPEAWARIAAEEGPGPRQRTTLWVDDRVLRFFRSTGKGWHGRMNDVLVAFVNARLSRAIRARERFDPRAHAREERLDGPPPPPGWSAWEQAMIDAIAEGRNPPPEPAPDRSDPATRRWLIAQKRQALEAAIRRRDGG
jgi:uncharacterized protein (DUF4415 family)